MNFIKKIFGTYSERELKKIKPKVDKILSLAPKYENMTADELRNQTQLFKNRLANGETLDDIMPEAYAVVREAASREEVLGMRHFPVQLMGGIIMHQGRIAEMRTGEGKTLVATLPVYLNALEGRGVHVVTVNDYLAERDSQQMGKVFEFLGLTVGCILHDMDSVERQAAYNCDITYGTNSEFGFDYLRDNMVADTSKIVQRELHFAVIDEIDSVLIDEARTPLIISGAGNKSTKLYYIADLFAKQLKKGRLINETEAMNALMQEELQEEGDFFLDEKTKTAALTQEGVAKAEHFFKVNNLSDAENLELQHHINNALKANYCMHLDKDYVVHEGEILIVDEFTGRMMPGRRFSNGLHQAIEAKEQVEVQKESQTLATITYQSFFNRYHKKCGMTGTGKTEEDEFRNIYSLDIVEIPTHRPVQRIDHHDAVFRTEKAKLNAIVEDIIASHKIGQPVLIGTITIEKSEVLSRMLHQKGIPHQVLNAKYHAQEAEIVALAGQMGAVTIATNMAGRGTDIKLGDGVEDLGGLKIIGTERHESRRIDNQLRGRAGRQGDRGESRFYISLEDDLMRLFGSERSMKIVDSLGMKEDESIEAGSLSKAIESAQKRVEGNNFAIRKQLTEYEQVMNEQRDIIYKERKKVLENNDLHEHVVFMMHQIVERVINAHIPDGTTPDKWDLTELAKSMSLYMPIAKINIKDDKLNSMTKEQLMNSIKQLAVTLYDMRETEICNHMNGNHQPIRNLEKSMLLSVIDQNWMMHIDEMDHMRQGIGLHAYAQRDPLQEYKFAAYDMFDEMNTSIQNETVRSLFQILMQPVQVQTAV